jgi:BirA family biotin operon repressor/biotin-[acetyl-CoA-carboxylase] ligase
MVDSTQRIAKELMGKGGGAGMVVVADGQSKGRGRLGREWISPSGGLYFSVVVKKRDAMSLLAGIAVAKALREFGLHAKIKWPNDILIKNKKIAGILVEIFCDHAIVGIGVNMDSAPLETSTSIREEGKSISGDALLEAILKNFEVGDVFYEYKELSDTIGRYVKIEMAGNSIEGKAIDIDRYGRLMVEKDGKVEKIASGDCIHLR